LSLHANIEANAGFEVTDAVYIGRIDAGKSKRLSGGGFTRRNMLAVVRSARVKASPTK
jgi:hypothetical protein